MGNSPQNQIIKVHQPFESLQKQLRDMVRDLSQGHEESKIICNGCGIVDWSGPRFKCVVCNNYDLCSDCFDRDYIGSQQEHKKSHCMILIRKRISPVEAITLKALFLFQDYAFIKFKLNYIVHNFATCATCKINPIEGIMIKCDECFSYYQCYECHTQKKQSTFHQIDHRKIAFVQPSVQILPLSVTSKLGPENKIGNGNFGSVHKLEYNGQTIAVKQLLNLDNCPQADVRGIEKEILALGDLTSSKILQFIGFRREEQTNGKIKYYLATEYLERGTLKKYLEETHQYITLYQRFLWVLDLIRGIRIIHKKGIIHKDLKSDNILIDNNLNLKISDFGIAAFENDKQKADQVLRGIFHKCYKPPEQVYGSLSFQSDIYQFGLLMNFIFTNKEHDIQEDHSRRQEVFKHVLAKNEIFKLIIDGCIEPNPHDRLTSEAVEAILQGFQNMLMSELESRKLNLEDYKKIGKQQSDELFRFVHEKQIAALKQVAP